MTALQIYAMFVLPLALIGGSAFAIWLPRKRRNRAKAPALSADLIKFPQLRVSND